jgi:hypothetical protein
MRAVSHGLQYFEGNHYFTVDAQFVLLIAPELCVIPSSRSRNQELPLRVRASQHHQNAKTRRVAHPWGCCKDGPCSCLHLYLCLVIDHSVLTLVQFQGRASSHSSQKRGCRILCDFQRVRLAFVSSPIRGSSFLDQTTTHSSPAKPPAHPAPTADSNFSAIPRVVHQTLQ